MVKPNFLVDKANIKHKPSIFTKNTMGQCWKMLRITCSGSWIVLFSFILPNQEFYDKNMFYVIVL